MFGYQRTVSAPAGAGGSQPSLVGVDPGQPPGLPAHLPSPGFPEMRPHTISSAYERYHARSALSTATFEPPPPPPPALRAPPPSLVHRPPLMHTHRPLGPPAGMIRSQRAQRDEVIYQSVLRTPGSPQQLQQQAINNGTCDTPSRTYIFIICFSRLFGPGMRVPKSHSSCSSCCCWYQFSRVQKSLTANAFLIRSGAQRHFAYAFVLTLPTDLPSHIFHLFSN